LGGSIGLEIARRLEYNYRKRREVNTDSVTLCNTSPILTFMSQIARLYQPLGTEYLESDDEAEGDSYEANDLLPRHAHATDPRPDSDPWSDAPPLLPSRDQADGVYANNGAQGGPPKTTARRSSLENVWDDREDLFSVGNVPSVPSMPIAPVEPIVPVAPSPAPAKVPAPAPTIPAPIAAATSIPPVTQTALKSASPATPGSGTAVAAAGAVATGAELFDVGGDDDDDEEDDEEEEEEEEEEESDEDDDEDDEDDDDVEEGEGEDDDEDDDEEEEEVVPARRPPTQS
jgi:hypothetical protein